MRAAPVAQPGAATGRTRAPPSRIPAPRGRRAEVSVGPGGSIARPVGSVLRLQLTYQGSDIGVTEARGVDVLLSKSDGADVPNNPSITDTVIYGSPYGTNGGAVELGHFTIN